MSGPLSIRYSVSPTGSAAKLTRLSAPSGTMKTRSASPRLSRRGSQIPLAAERPRPDRRPPLPPPTHQRRSAAPAHGANVSPRFRSPTPAQRDDVRMRFSATQDKRHVGRDSRFFFDFALRRSRLGARLSAPLPSMFLSGRELAPVVQGIAHESASPWDGGADLLQAEAAPRALCAKRALARTSPSSALSIASRASSRSWRCSFEPSPPGSLTIRLANP